jgi:sialate O-acetylesterase
MAVITDTVKDVKDIHPPDKKPVGERLALWALAETYGREKLVCCGPIYESMAVEGNSIRIRFRHAGSGLASRDGKPLTWFAIAGKDGTFHPAVARIDGDIVVVRSDKVPQPVAVRFAWSDIARPNLMNREGLPAAAFRTDAAKAEAFRAWRGPTKPSQPTD